MNLLDWYRRLTGSQTTEINALKAQIADLTAKNADLTKQIAALLLAAAPVVAAPAPTPTPTPTTSVLQSLYTGINGGMEFSNDNQGKLNTVTWKTDEAEPYAELNWGSGGTAGLRVVVKDNKQPGIYVSFWVRRKNSGTTKLIKLFGTGYLVGGNYSNVNFWCFDNNTLLGFSYSDNTVSGGDIDVQYTLGGYPTNNLPKLYYGTQFSRTPYPTQSKVHAANLPYNNTWHHIELWVKKDSGVADGELAVRLDDDNSTVAHFTKLWNRCPNSPGFDMVGLGEYSNVSAPYAIEDYKKFDMSFSRPTTWGI